jgi:hypothetical protein
MVIAFMMLAVESSSVIALRMMKLTLGGSGALHEAHLMISEKVDAAFEATANLMAGASGDDVIHRYRQHVAANALRLTVKMDVRS